MPSQARFEIRSAGEAEPLVSSLCKGVIVAAHAAGAQGVLERDAFPEFGRRGASLAQFNLFIESMARAGLVARGPDKRLRATVRGLAYAGIDAISQASVGRTPF